MMRADAGGGHPGTHVAKPAVDYPRVAARVDKWRCAVSTRWRLWMVVSWALLAPAGTVAAQTWPEDEGLTEPEPSDYGRFDVAGPSRKGRVSGGVAWSMGLGVGSTSEFVSDYSLRGFTVEGRYWVHNQATVGLLWGWTSLYERLDNRTYATDNIAITSTQIRWVDAMPLQLTAHYYVELDTQRVLPFIGTGVGTVWTERLLTLPFTSYSQESWHFALAPELGLLFPSPAGSFLISSRFNYAFETDAAPEAIWFNFNIGLMGF
jgi:hypothetical protein